MMVRQFVLIVSLALLLAPTPSPSTESELLIHYRSLDGKISHQSRNNAKKMIEAAKTNGEVTLFLLLDYPFNIYLDQMTPSEVEAQRTAVADKFREILLQDVSRGDVRHPASGPYIRGPMCSVRANAKGLRSLLTDKRILQITSPGN